MVFTDTDVPPAAGIRRRHQRRRITQGVVAGIAVAAVAVGLAVVVNDESASGPEGVVTDAPSGSAQLENSRWTLESTIIDGAENVVPDGDEVLVTFSAIQDCSETDPTAGIEGSCSMFVVQGVCVSFVTLVEVRESTLVSHEAGEVDPGCLDLGIGSLFESEVAYAVDGDTLTLTGADGLGVRLLRVPSDIEDTTEPPPDAPVPTFGPTTRMVASLKDGRIVELAGTGAVTREIFTLGDDEEVGELQLLDNGDVYFTVKDADQSPGGGGCGRLFRISSDGSETEPEDLGFDTGTFAVSPDGAAVAVSESFCDADLTGTVAIVNFATGERHEWTAPEDGDSAFETEIEPYGLSWSLDAQALAMSWCYEGCFTKVVDPNTDGVVDGAIDIVGGDAPAWTMGALWTMGTFFAEEPADRPITRYDQSSGDQEERLSPFGPGVQSLHADAEGLPTEGLIAFRYDYDTNTPSIERWDFSTVTALEVEDPGIEILAVGTKL